MTHCTIIDIGFGNIGSLEIALKECSFRYSRLSEPETIETDLIILPGVGDFGQFMKELRRRNFDKYLLSLYHSDKRILGICLGMQIMGKQSEEDKNINSGLNFFEFDVVSLEKRAWPYQIPNIGFRDTRFQSNELKSIYGKNHPFYYVHSFCIDPKFMDRGNVLATIDLGDKVYPMAVRSKNAIGVQFHPEKSHKSGLKILKYSASI